MAIAEPNKAQQFPFQTLGILLFRWILLLRSYKVRNFTSFTVYATIYGGFPFSYNYKEEIDHFTLDVLKMSDT